MTRIAVAYCFDRNYARPAAVSTYSLLKNSRSDVQIYWCVPPGDLADTLSLRACLPPEYVTRIAILEADLPRVADMSVRDFFTSATYMKLLLPDLIPEQRLIYMDADTLIRGDLAEFFTTELGPHHIAGVIDAYGSNHSKIPRAANDVYINAGVVLLDSESLRANGFFQRCRSVHDQYRNEIKFVDQCVINKVLEGEKRVIGRQWNTTLVANHVFLPAFNALMSSDARVLHFIGGVKPWHQWCNPLIAELWWSYAKPLNIPGLAPTPIKTVEQALLYARILDLTERYKEASTVKSQVIKALTNNLLKKGPQGTIDVPKDTTEAPVGG